MPESAKAACAKFTSVGMASNKASGTMSGSTRKIVAALLNQKVASTNFCAGDFFLQKHQTDKRFDGKFIPRRMQHGVLLHAMHTSMARLRLA